MHTMAGAILPFLPRSGPGYQPEPDSYPPTPGDLLLVVRVALVCAAALFVLALLFAVASVLRRDRRRRWIGFAVVAAILGALALLLAARAGDAYQPFASVRLPESTPYEQWVEAAGIERMQALAPTAVALRGWMVLGVIATAAMGLAGLNQVLLVLRRTRRRARGVAVADGVGAAHP